MKHVQLLAALLAVAPPALAQAAHPSASIQPLVKVGSPAPINNRVQPKQLQASPDTGKMPSADDLDQAAGRVADLLDGVLRNCPSSFMDIGTANKRCVGASGDVESLRQKLSAALGRDLYGPWRSHDDQRTVFNWVMMPSGPVYLRLEPENSTRTLIYLDAPLVSAASNSPASGASNAAATNAPVTTVINGVTIRKPAAQTAAVPSTKPQSKPTAKPIAPSPTTSTPTSTETTLAIMPFSRTLQLQNKRLHGADVLSVQNRLIALTLVTAPNTPISYGDGWYGPNTSKTVSNFQRANGLKVTGKVDKLTWDTLFSPSARKFGGE